MTKKLLGPEQPDCCSDSFLTTCSQYDGCVWQTEIDSASLVGLEKPETVFLRSVQSLDFKRWHSCSITPGTEKHSGFHSLHESVSGVSAPFLQFLASMMEQKLMSENFFSKHIHTFHPEVSFLETRRHFWAREKPQHQDVKERRLDWSDSSC